MKKLLPPASSFTIVLQFGLFAEFTAIQLTMKWLLHTHTHKNQCLDEVGSIEWWTLF